MFKDILPLFIFSKAGMTWFIESYYIATAEARNTL